MNAMKNFLILNLIFLLEGFAPTEERDLRPGSSSKRIINGGNADAHEWPWQVSLAKGTWHFCGGSIIEGEWVLTAAHCVQGKTWFHIVVGAHNRDQKTKHQEVHYPMQIFIHQSYHRSHLRADVALIRLTKRISLHDHVLAVDLPRQDDRVSPGTKCFVTGWGRTNGGDYNSGAKVLQEADLTIAQHQNCDNQYYFFKIDYNSMLCAGGQGKGSCNGDSGGPLVCHEGNRWVLRGVVSFGTKGCYVHYYSVFARVSSFVNWIQNKMNN